MLEITVNHELTHYFDDQLMVPYNKGEEGMAFETAVYGSVVWNYVQAATISSTVLSH